MSHGHFLGDRVGMNTEQELGSCPHLVEKANGGSMSKDHCVRQASGSKFQSHVKLWEEGQYLPTTQWGLTHEAEKPI